MVILKLSLRLRTIKNIFFKLILISCYFLLINKMREFPFSPDENYSPERYAAQPTQLHIL